MDMEKLIAIIDNGINEQLLKHIIKKISFDEDDNCIIDNTRSRSNQSQHGTNCACVLRKYCPNVDIVSIRILEENGNGYINKFSLALDWCDKNRIKIINASFGTENFRDKKELKNIINHYVNKGMIIVAASPNSGNIGYPASFSNVIGVVSGRDLMVGQNIQLLKGIDFIAPSDHEILIEGVSFRLGKSNSYAAPYITALVGNLISAKGYMTVDEIRDQLCEGRNSFIYAPDWIESAWITPDYKRSKAEYYFDEDTRSLQECFDDIDTIVFLNSEDVDKYIDLGKHIVYIGEGNIHRFDKKHHFWSKELRREQIMSSKKKSGELDIPTIYCIFVNQIDVIWYLCELKSLFANDGYNAFTGCSSVDSVLYDLEYLPDEDEIREELVDFVYWQTYYQQSDLVLIGALEKDCFINEPDMVAYFYPEKDGITVRIICDEDTESEIHYSDLEVECITKIYGDIVSRFEKEDE